MGRGQMVCRWGRWQGATPFGQRGKACPYGRGIGIAGVLFQPVPQLGRIGVVIRVQVTVCLELTQQGGICQMRGAADGFCERTLLLEAQDSAHLSGNFRRKRFWKCNIITFGESLARQNHSQLFAVRFGPGFRGLGMGSRHNDGSAGQKGGTSQNGFCRDLMRNLTYRSHGWRGLGPSSLKGKFPVCKKRERFFKNCCIPCGAALVKPE